jgi:hypothetical protein
MGAKSSRRHATAASSCLRAAGSARPRPTAYREKFRRPFVIRPSDGARRRPRLNTMPWSQETESVL